MIEIEYVGSIQEDLGVDEDREQLAWSPEMTDIAALIEVLCTQRGERWSIALHQDGLLFSVNESMVKLDHPLADGDKLAIYPAIAGG